ncbi:MAG: TolC family outer membrane protein [Gammaproteobacteria bacterium]|nr:TolC family outer membrane protein [Rhodocyclaceae bacterium]MBU3908136.1 TolC family outer membrane protein [Gammaproteobacteria bacterium]MBU3989731.1 TolC family outer membrane protein [Gammaproteobacteria bacterium]MBU4005777.1 TolC family outer membrane protein [Gammaproteobacteria bacterium]MBU4021475.1 TolC family outer membrane protein [Gammaproteobacteria bacterium]
MKKPSMKSLIVLAFAASAVNAQSADLLQVYRDAMGFDAQYAAARAQLDAGREKLPQGRAGLLPTLGLTASTTWNNLESTARSAGATTRTADYNSNGWSVALSQPLFRWQNWVGYKQAELAVASAETQFAQAGQDLILRVSQAYFDVLLAQETLATTQAQKIAIAQQLESAKRNFEVGTATITDTHEAQARFDLADAQQIAAENDLAVKQQTLLTLTGKEAEALKGLRPKVQIKPPQPDNIGQWVESAETGNLGVQLAQTNLEISRREIEKQRAGHYPTLDIVATHGNSGVGYSSTTGTGVDSKTSAIGLQLAVPLFAGGAVSSRDREAVALNEKARADLDNARRVAALSARQSYFGVNAGLAQVRALEAGVASSQLAVESNKLGYEVGVRINIDVLNAQSQLFDTRQKLAKARLDTLISQLRLKAATGSLSEDDLMALNALLD